MPVVLYKKILCLILFVRDNHPYLGPPQLKLQVNMIVFTWIYFFITYLFVYTYIFLIAKDVQLDLDSLLSDFKAPLSTSGGSNRKISLSTKFHSRSISTSHRIPNRVEASMMVTGGGHHIAERMDYEDDNDMNTNGHPTTEDMNYDAYGETVHERDDAKNKENERNHTMLSTPLSKDQKSSSAGDDTVVETMTSSEPNKISLTKTNRKLKPMETPITTETSDTLKIPISNHDVLPNTGLMEGINTDGNSSVSSFADNHSNSIDTKYV